MDFEFEEGAPLRGIRGYRVLAETPAQAKQMAIDFETRCGGKNVRVGECSTDSPEIACALGVSYRQGMIFYSAEEAG